MENVSAVKTWLIVNPNAGSAGQPGGIRELIADRPSIIVKESRAEGDARRIAAEAVRQGIDLIVAAGGDGTVHEVVNGIMDAAPKRAKMGLIPMGTGNDLARTLAIPNDPRDALALLLAGRDEAIDLIRVDAEGAYRHLVNAAAGGFSGQVNEAMSAEMKSQWGPLAYVMGAATVLPDVTGYHTTIAYDDAPPVQIEAVNIIVANGRTVAGGVRVAPFANPQDGLLNVVVVEKSSVLDLAAVGAQLLTGNYLDSAHVRHRTARKVEIVSHPGMWFNVDGELLTKEPIRFEVVPAALHVVVGPDYVATPEPV
ncbi:MAG TPA: diacylglycerol kinase family protein [Rhodothermales bacterium]|nr:diacylglycerol kinase family protein [Rhodothermales bacterium]